VEGKIKRNAETTEFAKNRKRHGKHKGRGMAERETH
jgi:hypothetical protein